MVTGAPGLSRRPARTPSETKLKEVAGSRLFALDNGVAVNFGRIVHELLAQVEWVAGDDAKRGEVRWRDSGAAGEEALACLNASQLAHVWAQPGPAAEVWRERAFEIVLEGAWVTGVFDRVVLWRDVTGRYHRAVVYDFKTDRGAGADLERAAARHAGQIQLYRRVVAVLTALPLEKVEAQLVFTESRLSVAITGT